jgi:hypothetical protein
MAWAYYLSFYLNFKVLCLFLFLYLNFRDLGLLISLYLNFKILGLLFFFLPELKVHRRTTFLFFFTLTSKEYYFSLRLNFKILCL